MVAHSSSRIFTLPELDLDASYPSLKSLPAVQPRFSIPLLDEHSSGSERLLSGVNSLSFASYAPSKGKGGEVAPLEEDEDIPVDENVLGNRRGQQGAEGGQSDVWLEVSREDAEMGRPARTFRVSSLHLSNAPAYPPKPIRTWDVPGPADNAGNPFLSESSVFAFDSQITLSEPPLDLPKLKQTGPIPPRDSKGLLQLMMRATMGTISTEALRWDSKKSRYTFAEADGRIIGVDERASSSAIGKLLVIGTALRRLEIIVDSQSSIPLTPTHHALLHATSTYLASIRQRLTSAIDECVTADQPDWLKWTSELDDIRELLEVLCDLLCWPLSATKPLSLPPRASALSTHLYSFLLARFSTSPAAHQADSTSLALAYLLEHSSQPLLNLLHQWIGLADATVPDDDVDPASQPWADLGITRMESRQSSTDEMPWDYTFSSRHMPGFIPLDSRRILFEAGRSLRLLRAASGGQHPLCFDGWGIQATWGWGPGTVQNSTADVRSHVWRIQRAVEHWRRSVSSRARSMPISTSLGRLKAPPKQRKGLPIEFTRPSTQSSPLDNQGQLDSTPERAGDVDSMWALFEQLPGSHLTSKKGSSLWSSTPLDELRAFITRGAYSSHPLLPFEAPTLPLYVSQCLLKPLHAHAELVSTSLVSLYLDDLGFLDHLDVLQSFWLGADVGFAERVSGALFGKEEAGAGEALGLGKRARTRARMGLNNPEQGMATTEGEWGIGLGLGLSERARWPPGGVELAYALRTTLLDGNRSLANNDSPIWEEIEDRVSFAIRNLPEDNKDGTRAKWMNPQSIDALDFLYLSYTPPPSIANLLPTSLMTKYQRVHNFLLRLARVDTVLRTLYMDVTHQCDQFDEPLKIGVDLGSRPASRASVASSSRQRKLLFPPGERIEGYLQKLRFRMTHFVSALNRYVLDTAIGANWGLMRKRLERLKRRSPGKELSRPSTPAPGGEADEYFEFSAEDDDEEEGEGEINVSQLKSIRSLVGYHHVVLDRILRSCLLSDHAGQQVTYKVLMALFGLVLDLGKLVKEIERGLRGWEEGAERVRDIGREWAEREAVFLHALERLSLRAVKGPVIGDEGTADADEQDLKVLLDGERGGEDEGGDAARSTGEGQGAGDLAELLLRLGLNGGKWARQNEAV